MVRKAANETRYASEDLKSLKILEKLNSKPKSDQQLKAEEKYKKQGYHPDEAAVQAYKNVRMKRALTIAAGTAVTVGAIYTGHKLSEEHLDKIIKKGSSLQNVSYDSDKGVRDAFYSSKNRLDKLKYRGLFGAQILRNNDGLAYTKEIKTLSDLKQASPKNAKKALKELLDSNNDFRIVFTDQMERYSRSKEDSELIKRATGNGKGGGKLDAKVYDMFNTALVNHSPRQQGLTDMFYSNLSEKGYNAIRDVNDSKQSGYKAINPIIAFNTKGKVSVVDVRQLSEAEVKKDNIRAMTVLNMEPMIKSGMTYTALALGSYGVTSGVLNAQRRQAVNRYLKDNPNTEMSRTEIQRMLERSSA